MINMNNNNIYDNYDNYNLEGLNKKLQKTNFMNKQQTHNSICSYLTSYNTKSNTNNKISKKITIDKTSIFNEFENFNKIKKEKFDANKSIERNKNFKKILFKSASTSNLKETNSKSKISDNTSYGLYSIKNGTISSGSNLNCGTITGTLSRTGTGTGTRTGTGIGINTLPDSKF
jgi:hypothetical protein